MFLPSKFSRITLHVQGNIGMMTQKWATTVANERIDIPKKIPRGPTDILRALESTVGRDPTATHYKYHDDPFLIPMSNIGKRTFAMSQEAGRKAAQWVRDKHPELFNHREADPVIKTFLPKMVYTEQSDVTEEDLIFTISNVQVTESKLVYGLLKEKGVQISQNVLEDMIELLCFYNEDDSLSEEAIEERWFRQLNNTKDKQRKTWKDGGLAEELFRSIENPTTRMYSSIIQGMCKYLQVDRAYQLFEEALQKGFLLPAETYNSVIRVANVVKEGYDLRWSHIINLLGDMNKASIKPNVGTMNAVLSSVSIMGKSHIPKENALKILSEFKLLGIEPSLGTWYYILITFCKQHGPQSPILHNIMKQIENKSHKIRDASDTNFFVTAMDIAANHLNDIDLGQRVDDLLNFADNYNLIGDSYRESIYYRHYFTLNIRSRTLDDFLENVYNVLVPNIYVPEPSIMMELLTQVELNGAVEYIPKLWSDMIIFEHTGRINIVDKILDIMYRFEPEKGSSLHASFASIAMDIHQRVESQHERKTNKLQLTGEQFGKMMTLQVRHDNLENALTIFYKFNEQQNTIAGIPRFEDLSNFVDKCIEHKTPAPAILCVQLCSEYGFPDVNQLTEKITNKLTLDENHLSKLSRISNDTTTITKG